MKLVEELEEGTGTFDVGTFSPFAFHLIYKAAAIVTERLQVGLELETNLQRVRILRKILRLVGHRWLAGRKQKI